MISFSVFSLLLSTDRGFMAGDSINRFSRRADHYDRYRPGYPAGLAAFIRSQAGLTPASAVADIAAGTGIFTELLAAWGNPIYAIEPNAAMRQLAARRLRGFPNCRLMTGTAESTGLPDRSVDLFTAAQAFHWFDPQAAKTEFIRVGREGAQVAIVWNIRRTDTPFEAAYESLIRAYGTDYLEVSRNKMDSGLVQAFFAPVLPEYRVFVHTDELSLEQLLGRTASYSYVPEASSTSGQKMVEALKALFGIHQHDGRVRLSYESRLYIGALSR